MIDALSSPAILLLLWELFHDFFNGSIIFPDPGLNVKLTFIVRIWSIPPGILLQKVFRLITFITRRKLLRNWGNLCIYLRFFRNHRNLPAQGRFARKIVNWDTIGFHVLVNLDQLFWLKFYLRHLFESVEILLSNFGDSCHFCQILLNCWINALKFFWEFDWLIRFSSGQKFGLSQPTWIQ